MNHKQSPQRIDLKKVTVTALFIACCVAVILLFQLSQDQNKITLTGAATQKIAPRNLDPVTQLSLKRLKLRPQPVLSQPGATIPTAPPEDPDEARAWARENPSEALAWLKTAHAGPERDTVAEMACAHLAESDPAQAVSLAERYAGGSGNLLENLVQQWAEKDQAAAYSYAVNKSPGDNRDHLLSRVAFARSKKSPVEAAKLVVEWIAPGNVQNEAAMSVIHQWALRDPNGALEWAQMFPEITLRVRAMEEVKLVIKPN
jgi:hypothetical protein